MRQGWVRLRGLCPRSGEGTALPVQEIKPFPHVPPAPPKVGPFDRGIWGKGDVAKLSGELVDVNVHRGGYSGWWRTSLSRNDTGNGSCEVLYLRRLKEDGRVYE